ncbi:uncharacterized protein LAESUDRAFT_706792 [Laetiporus sulphureus 93-53]|uniref:Uncharacterized protein n=1 Tax=Laetiporus sulphureus 93-53 TaxID=1314785 RepID=A0A165C0F6_9APHY|nr:uncharacterized protein LAESUDRAFT_706792 [Laetiporus sulphureus 93-53]KZT01974.1 hypothetical protein LAESUDRAFT_706792 [Laetiporus sulphureus 93-53]
MFEEEDDYAVPYDTLRHKSIRRGILERLKFGTLRRPAKEGRDISDAEKSLPIPEESPVRRVSHRQGHKRNDSDFNVDEVRLPAMQRSVSSPGPNLLRSPSFGMRDDSPLLHSPGFRIIEEDPEADTSSILERYLSPFIPHRHTVSVHQKPSKDSVRTHSPAADSYTAMPARRSAAEKRSSPYGTPSSSPSKPPASSLARVDSSILPLSPPRIMSPPLESKLFFAAITPDFGSTPSLALHLPATSTNPSATSISSPAPPKRQQNKLRTKKDPPLLPYPSSSDSSPYRNRLKKSFRHGNVTGETPLSQQLVSASPQSVASPAPSTQAEWCSPATRFGVRHSALEKVDEILSRSWSQRDVNVDLYVGSATRFGAMVADTLKNDVRDGIPTSASGAGIQQRLEALKTQEQAANDRV